VKSFNRSLAIEFFSLTLSTPIYSFVVARRLCELENRSIGKKDFLSEVVVVIIASVTQKKWKA
jgi:hypothetical protein